MQSDVIVRGSSRCTLSHWRIGAIVISVDLVRQIHHMTVYLATRSVN